MEHAHVVFVLPVLEPAGAERIVAELARRMPEQGFSTSVICLEDEKAPVGRELSAGGVAVQGLHISRRRTLACAKALMEHLPAQRPLIVQANLFHANVAARLAFQKVNIAARAGVHVLSAVHVVERRFRPWQFALDRATAKYARCEVCVSRAVAKFQQQKTGLPESFFKVVENGIDLSRFARAKKSHAGGLRVVSAGRLDPQKDYATLLKAWKIVAAALPDARLTIAGRGAELEKLQTLGRKLELGSVTFAGFVEDIPKLFAESDLYVQSSAWEGFGLAVAEAMAAGLPVIVTDVDSLPEVVTHEKTGIVVPKRSPKLLAESIVRLLMDGKRAAHLAAAAKAEANARFSVERMVRDYARLYREIIVQRY